MRATANTPNPPFVGVVQPAWMAGHNGRYKRRNNKERFAVTVDMNSDPVLLTFRRRRSTGKDGRARRLLQKDKRERSNCDNQQQQQSQSNNQQQEIAIANKSKAITKCVLLLLSNWSEFILHTNGIENVPHCSYKIHVLLEGGKMRPHFTIHFTLETNPTINLGLGCRNDWKINLF